MPVVPLEWESRDLLDSHSNSVTTLSLFLPIAFVGGFLVHRWVWMPLMERCWKPYKAGVGVSDVCFVNLTNMHREEARRSR